MHSSMLVVMAALCLAPLLASAAVPMTVRLGLGSSCTDAPTKCTKPLSCVGGERNKKCFMKKELGMACGKDPFWVCRNGLVCSGDVCKEEVQQAGRCGVPGVACAAGLSCVGLPTNRRCYMRKALGMACGKDPFWVCRNGLVCAGGVCKEALGVGSACEGVPGACDEGLSCVGNVGNKKCFMKKELGMACGKDPFWVCRNGLVCNKRVCEKAGTQGSACGPGETCDKGLVCVGNATNRRCFPPVLEGDKCGKDPFWACSGSLTCVDGMCTA